VAHAASLMGAESPAIHRRGVPGRQRLRTSGNCYRLPSPGFGHDPCGKPVRHGRNGQSPMEQFIHSPDILDPPPARPADRK